MRLDRHHFRIHIQCGLPVGIIVACLAVWYIIASRQAGMWLRGGSLPALCCGAVAATFVLLDILLGMRKRLRAWRLLPAKFWMAGHLWMGVAIVPLAWMHSGFHFGGRLPSILLCVLTATFASGLFGWVMQQIIPGLILKHVPAETVLGEIPEVSQGNIAELKLMITQAFGPALTNELKTQRESMLLAAVDSTDEQTSPGGPQFLIGARREQAATPKGSRTQANESDPRDALRIWTAFEELSKFLASGEASGSFLKDQEAAHIYFQKLLLACQPSAAPLIEAMQNFCTERRSFDLQKRLNNWLVGWLPFHIAMATCLTGLLVVHIVTALRYW